MLKQRVQELAVRPLDGGEGQSSDKQWEEELSATVDRLDKRLLQRESDILPAVVAPKPEETLKTSSVG
jgi:hypothetical protein